MSRTKKQKKTGPKRYSSHCGNNGSCPVCLGNRTHKHHKSQLSDPFNETSVSAPLRTAIKVLHGKPPLETDLSSEYWYQRCIEYLSLISCVPKQHIGLVDNSAVGEICIYEKGVWSGYLDVNSINKAYQDGTL